MIILHVMLFDVRLSSAHCITKISVTIAKVLSAIMLRKCRLCKLRVEVCHLVVQDEIQVKTTKKQQKNNFFSVNIYINTYTVHSGKKECVYIF